MENEQVSLIIDCGFVRQFAKIKRVVLRLHSVPILVPFASFLVCLGRSLQKALGCKSHSSRTNFRSVLFICATFHSTLKLFARYFQLLVVHSFFGFEHVRIPKM